MSNPAPMPVPVPVPVPVTLLTGFLGSGKTTLLNALLRDPSMPRTAVIINEYGEIGLDGLLLGDAGRDAVMLPNGCLCCVVRDDLALVLQQIAAERTGQFGQMVIETSGLADPGPLLRTLMHDPGLIGRYRLNGVLTLVDAVHGAATLADHAEARVQAALADRMLMTKADIASPDQIAATRVAMAGAGPAPIWTQAPPPAALFAMSLYDATEGRMRPDRWLPADASHGHHGGHDINSFTLIRDRPLPMAVVQDWLEMLARFRGTDLLRVKGILCVAERPDEAVAIHGVQGLFHPPVPIGPWPTEDRRSRIVFITRSLDRKDIEATLDLVGLSVF